MSNVETVLNQARAWIGLNEKDGSHQQIIDVYNGHKPLARGYKVKNNDNWCATFVSACAIKTGLTDVIPLECSCGNMINLAKNMGIWNYKVKNNDNWCATFVSACAIKTGLTDVIPLECSCGNMINLAKNMGIWNEDGKRSPNVGDIIMYDWDNQDGWPEHVGIVESVTNNQITVIEGNKSNAVGRRVINVGNASIRGYIQPNYDGSISNNQPSKPISNEKAVNYKVKVNTKSGVNCRKKPSVGSAKITAYTNETILHVTKEQNGWLYVNDTGWVSEQYCVKVTGSSSSSSSAKITAYTNETILHVTKEQNGWLYVNDTGWVSEQYCVKVTGSSSSSSNESWKGDTRYYLNNSAVGEWQAAMNKGFDTNELEVDDKFGAGSQAFAKTHLLWSGQTHNCPTAIKWLQERLRYYGFTKLEVNGEWSDYLTTCVKTFQNNRGLEADGKVGLITTYWLLEGTFK